MLDLPQIKNIPSMGGRQISQELYDIASNLTGVGHVVECGCWLGASSAPVAIGLHNSDIKTKLHAFDRFVVGCESEVEKARNQGVEIDLYQDTKEIYLSNVQPLFKEIVLHQGDLMDARWDYSPIELYIDDACKSYPLFSHALSTFLPSWIPGKTILVLMDFNYYRKSQGQHCDAQKRFIDMFPNHFEVLFDCWPTCSTVCFKYVRSISRVKLNLALKKLYVHRSINKLSRIISNH